MLKNSQKEQLQSATAFFSGILGMMFFPKNMELPGFLNQKNDAFQQGSGVKPTVLKGPTDPKRRKELPGLSIDQSRVPILPLPPVSMAVTAGEGWFTCCHPWKKWSNKTKVLKNIPNFRKVILNVSYQRIGDGYLKMIIYHILVSKFGSRGVFLHHPLEFKERPNWNSVL